MKNVIAGEKGLAPSKACFLERVETVAELGCCSLFLIIIDDELKMI